MLDIVHTVSFLLNCLTLGRRTRYTSSSIVPRVALNKTTISEEHEPSDNDDPKNHNTECSLDTLGNFEKSSLGSETVCTSEMNSLHVNPGSREEFSEVTGDVSGNVSSACEDDMQDFAARKAKQKVQKRFSTGRPGSEYFHCEKRADILNDGSCIRSEVGRQKRNSLVQNEISSSSDVQGRTVDDRNRNKSQQNRVATTIKEKDHKCFSSGIQPDVVLAREDKDFSNNRNELAQSIQHCKSEEQDGVTEGRTGQQGENRSSFDEGRTGEGVRKMTNETGICRQEQASKRSFRVCYGLALTSSPL